MKKKTKQDLMIMKHKAQNISSVALYFTIIAAEFNFPRIAMINDVALP